MYASIYVQTFFHSYKLRDDILPKSWKTLNPSDGRLILSNYIDFSRAILKVTARNCEFYTAAYPQNTAFVHVVMTGKKILLNVHKQRQYIMYCYYYNSIVQCCCISITIQIIQRTETAPFNILTVMFAAKYLCYNKNCENIVE